MKLKTIFESILCEIGDASQFPPNGIYNVREHAGSIKFELGSDRYTVDIRLPVVQNGVVVIVIDFDTEKGEFAMTNNHQALKVMGYVVGGVEMWLSKYKKKYVNSGELMVSYIKFNPKSESGEKQDDRFVNIRDRLYRQYIEKFAARHGSSATFSTANGVVAVFNPKLKI